MLTGMNMFSSIDTLLVFLATTAPPKPPEEPSSFGPEFFIALAIFLIASIYLIQKPKQREEEARKKAQAEGMKKGTRVVSAGGIHGKVARTNKARDTVFVTVAQGVDMEFNRTALTEVKEEEKKEVLEETEKKGQPKAKKGK
jgi:preprotein translocase subunit YajC